MSGPNRGRPGAAAGVGPRPRSGRGGSRRPPKPLPPKGTDARRLAAEALVRIDTEGAYANLVVPGGARARRTSRPATAAS